MLLRAGLAAQRAAAAAAAADDDGAPGKRKRRPRELEDEDAMVGAVPKVRPWGTVVRDSGYDRSPNSARRYAMAGAYCVPRYDECIG